MASRASSSSRPTQPVALLVPQGAHTGKPSMPLNRPLTLVGSRHRAHLHLLSRTISKTHAVLINTSEGIYIRDLASRTHVLVNGEPVKEALLAGGDLVKLGSFTFRYNAAPGRRVIGKSPPEGALEIQGSPIAIPIEGRTVLIGRRPTCDIPLTEMSVSICHALIFQIDGIRYVRDLGSRTGTFVNGQTVHQHALEVGDVLRIGDTEIRYVDEEGAEAQLDELEDLVGTASLTDDAPALMGPIDDAVEPHDSETQEDAEPSHEIQVAASPVSEPVESFDFAEDHPPAHRAPATTPAAHETSDDDLIPIFDVDEPIPVQKSPVKELPAQAPPIPLAPVQTAVEPPASAPPVAAAAETHFDDLDLIPLADSQTPRASAAPVSRPAAKPVEDLIELDLASDPDVSGSGDTARVPMDAVLGRKGATPAAPIISDLVVDEPDNAVPFTVAPGSTIDRTEHRPVDAINLHDDDHASQILVDANLHEQRLSSSGTFAGLDLDLGEEIEAHSGNVQVDVKDLSHDAWEPAAVQPAEEPSAIPVPPALSLEVEPAESAGENSGSNVTANVEPEEIELSPISANAEAEPDVAPAESADVTVTASSVEEVPTDVISATDSSEAEASEPEPVAADSTEAEGAFADLDLSALDFSDTDQKADAVEGATEATDLPAASTSEATPLLGLTGAAAGATAGLIGLSGSHVESPAPSIESSEAEVGIEPAAIPDSATESDGNDAEPEPERSRFSWRGRRSKNKLKKQPPPKPQRIPPTVATSHDTSDDSSFDSDSSTDSSISATAHGADVDDASAEILASTSPTPESAQGLASEIVGSGLGGLVAEPEAAMTDSTFGRAVQEFSGSHLDPLEETSDGASPPATTSSESDPFPIVSDSESADLAGAEPMVDLGYLDDAPMTESGLTDLSFEIAEQVLAADAAFATSNDFDEELAHDLGLISEDPFAATVVEDLEAPLELAPIEKQPDASSFTDPTEELATLLGEPPKPIEFNPIGSQPRSAGVPSAEPLSAEALGAADDEREIDLSAYLSPAGSSAGASFESPTDQSSTYPGSASVPASADRPPSSGGQGGLDMSLLGMTRDQASFIGGMPINWDNPQAASNPAPAAPQYPMSRDELVNPESDFVPDALISEALKDPADDALNFAHDGGEETLASFLARLETSEPTPELFESTPGKLDALPDSMFPIQDVVEVLGEQAAPRQPEDLPDFLTTSADVLPQSGDRARNPASPLVPPRVIPPPPPRVRGSSRGKGGSAPVASNPFGAGSEAPVGLELEPSEITIPPYTGTKPASMGHITTAFDGLAKAPVRETDVFSQLSNATAVGALSGLSADIGSTDKSIRHGLTGAEFHPGETAGRRGRSGGFSGGGSPPSGISESRTTIPDYAPLPRPAPGAPSPRFPSRQSKAALDASKPGRRRLRPAILLPLVIILAAGSLAAIYFFIHAQASAHLFLRFDGLDKVTQQERLELERQQRENLSSPETMQFARQVYQSANGGKGDGGFLGTPTPQEHAAYAALVDSAQIPSGSNKLTMQMASVDPAADKLRLFALLQALYSRNQKMGDDAARARDAYNLAIKASDDAKDKITRLSEQVKAEADSVSKMTATLSHVTALKDDNAGKWKAWTDAAAQLRDAQADVDRLDVKPIVVGDNLPADGAPTKAEDDAQIKELSARLTTLTNNLSAARTSHTASTDAANKALDAALGGFQSRIAAARSSLKDGSELSGYLAAAQQAQDTIRQLNADLIDRQKSEQQRLNELRRVLGEKQEARLKAAWESDPQLTQMQQDLSVAEHRYNVASGSGLGTDAKTLSTQIDPLKKQIDARRDLIGTGDIYADEVKGLQQFIDDSLKGMDRERARNDQRMADALKTLADAAPKIEKLPIDQQKMAEDFESRLSEMTKARQQFNAAIAAPDADANIKALETESTELQAKLDTRRKQLSDESRKALSRQQETARAAALEAAKTRLAAAKEAETNASIAVRANKEQLDDVQIAADQGRAVQARLVADNTRLLELQASQKQQQQKADDLYGTVQQSVIPEKPTEDNVTISEINDPRKVYMLYTSLGYALLLVVMLLAMSRGMHHHPPIHTSLASGPASRPDIASNGHAFEHAGTLEGRGSAREHSDEHAEDEATLTV